MTETHSTLIQSLWKIYRRPDRPSCATDNRDLPWGESAFSERMLFEHLDESHGAASRITEERQRQIAWLWAKLDLESGTKLFDVTCGPGLYAVEFAQRGCEVTGLDISPAAITYATNLAASLGLDDQTHFIEQDIRHLETDYENDFEAALLLYGQLATLPRTEAQHLLSQLAQALKPGGKLCLELLDQEKVDKKDSRWWFTDEKGVWGNSPFLHLGERFWHDSEQMSIERYSVLHLETGDLDQIHLCDQTYAQETMVTMLEQAGFQSVKTYPGWDGLPLYDAEEWIVYVAQK